MRTANWLSFSGPWHGTVPPRHMSPLRTPVDTYRRRHGRMHCTPHAPPFVVGALGCGIPASTDEVEG